MEAIALKRVSLVDQSLARPRRDIFTGVYRPGEDLPPERELALMFGTSRVTMRKALAALAQEGWIEIVQRRGNTVLDFHDSVGLEVVPSLFLSCPEAVITPAVFETMVSYSAWLFENILLDAAAKARPKDEPRLLELLEEQQEGIGARRFRENEFRFYGELLRIGDNLIHQLYYNSQKKFIRDLLDLGVVRIPA
jgi:DNA-binding FadR family transcriptional regulator